MREILRQVGLNVPVLGDYADAPAADLLDALYLYDEPSAAQETAGWLARRSPADAAIEIIDAGAGTGPGSAVRRAMATSLLAGLQDDKAVEVLHSAAASAADGSKHVAVQSLIDRGADPAEYGRETTMWLAVDQLAGPLDASTRLDIADLADNGGQEMRDMLRAGVNEIWRCDHPATLELLDALGEAYKSVDKGLAKQLRKAAFKLRSRG